MILSSHWKFIHLPWSHWHILGNGTCWLAKACWRKFLKSSMRCSSQVLKSRAFDKPLSAPAKDKRVRQLKKRSINAPWRSDPPSDRYLDQTRPTRKEVRLAVVMHNCMINDARFASLVDRSVRRHCLRATLRRRMLFSERSGQLTPRRFAVAAHEQWRKPNSAHCQRRDHR